jgi:CO dehydrogenase nickel-insertion accessory protein CooC1
MKLKTNREKLLLAGKRIGIFGKGGAGKSTATVLLARGLRDLGYQICVLDTDSTNIGLPHALGIDRSPNTLIEYFGGMVFSGGKVTCPVDDPTVLPDSEIDLEKLPSYYVNQNKEGIFLLVAGKIGDLGPGAGCDGPIAKIARDLRINAHGNAVLTMVDFKAGFEDSARGAITTLDWAIVLVDPSVAAVEMAANMRDMVRQIKNGKMPATQHLEDPELVATANKWFARAQIKDVIYLLNKIKNSETEEYLRSKLYEHRIIASGAIYEDPTIYSSWLTGNPIEIDMAQESVFNFIRKLEAAEDWASTPLNREPVRG